MKSKQLNFFPKIGLRSNLLEDLKALFEIEKIRLGLWLSLLPVALVFLAVMGLWTKLPPQVPLFYSRPWGENQLAKKSWLLILPGIYFLIMIFNLRLASLFFKKESLLAKILIWTTAILACLLGTTMIRILLVVL